MIYVRMVLQLVSPHDPFSSFLPLFCTASFAESLLFSQIDELCVIAIVGCRIIQAEDLETWVFGLKVLGDESETVYSGGELCSSSARETAPFWRDMYEEN